MTKTERVDILLDAIGLIGDDLIAESSGISKVLPIPSKLRLNLIVMRRLIAAAVFLMIISAITPLSVHLYNNYIAPAFQPEATSAEEVSDTEKVPETENEIFDIPEGYVSDGYTSFEILALSDGNQKKASVFAFTLSGEDGSSRALYLEIRSFDKKEITDTALFPGYTILLLAEAAPDELIIFNTELKDESSMQGYASVAKYSVKDGILSESEWSGEHYADFDLSSEESVDGSRMGVFNLFITLADEIEASKSGYLIIDTYSSDTDRIHHPDEKVSAPDINGDRKSGKTTWSLERICKLFGYEAPVITEKEPVPDITLENGLVLSYVETEDGNIFYNVTGCSTEPMEELRIPNEYNGIPIYTVQTNVLSECRAETVIFPAGLTVFYKQKLTGGVKRVVIECNTDTNFQLGVFRGSTIKEAVFTGNIVFLTNETFCDCTELERVVLPETLVGIGENAFDSCESLSEINFPAGLRGIQEDAFISCSSLKKLVFPEGFESVGNSAFAGCVGVTEIVIPSTLKKIETNAFAHHSCEVITLPEGVEHLGNSAFLGDKLRIMYIPRSLTYWDKNFLFTNELAVEKIYYNGTKDEFARNMVMPQAGKTFYTIVCTDGEIRIEK